MPREFRDRIANRNARTEKADPNLRSGAPQRERRARRKGQYTTVRGTPIIQGKPS